MARRSGWEILNDGVLDSPLGYLGFFSDILNRILPCHLFFVFLPMCWLAFLRHQKKHSIHTTRAALRALLVVMTPTCSLWPSRYIELANILRLRVNIPLEMIIEDTANGVIEFRNPINDLADLIGSGVTIDGHTICIKTGWKWWISCFQWWTFGKFESGYTLGLSEWLINHMPAADPDPLGLPSGLFTLNSPPSCPLFCLDHLPHNTIPSLNAGCKATFEFTTFSPSLQTLSAAQIISAIPFLISKRSSRRPRTLVSVLKRLSAQYSPNIVIQSVSNISADYEHTLCHMHGSFSKEQDIRELCIKNIGIKAWRQVLFLVALEAALLHRGWLERWAIQVTAG